MKYSALRSPKKSLAGLVIVASMLMQTAVFGQTQIKLHSNKFSPAQDVQLGRQAAAEAEQQFPLMRDSQVSSYVERVGQRLAASIPGEFQHREFRYYFRVINASDINAFALPGGPMYVNRGMIQAARTEGEMAGVMAHELSHVALRHGTAQATKAQKYAVGAGIAGVLGSILGGPALGQLAQLPIGAYFLKFSREYETEADLLGARIMANAGYDPRDLANMFQTIQAQGGGGGGFLSDHPSAKDRYAKINQEAQYLRINTAARLDDREFFSIRERLSGYPRAPSMAEIQRSGRRYPNQGDQYPSQYPNQYPDDRNGYPVPTGRVDYPSARLRTYNEGLFTVSIPENWRQLNQGNEVWFSPNGGYGSATNGQATFTHAVNFGTAQSRYGNLQQATNDFINNLQQGNANMRANSGYQRVNVDGRNALALTMNNVNEATGQREIVMVMTTQLRNGQLFYMLAVTPSNEFASYQGTFQSIVQSLRIND